MPSENTRRIAKNTLFLYLRMLFSMAVSLYTSRVVLKTLGVEDFGIYNIVAGIIAMFSFLSVSMSSATSRFLAYELGNENYDHLQKIFSAALTLYLFIALCILLLGETIGLWFLYNKLVIPTDRMFAAGVIYQLSLFSSILFVFQIPYNAMIMANERMDVYAYIEIANVILRLLIVFLLVVIPGDKLIIYVLLLLLVTFVILFVYSFYCRKNLIGCCFRFSRDRKVIYPMLTFSGWDLYGNASVLVRTQGVNILLNIFFGALMNAASGIATQVQSAVMSFAGSVLSAVRPQIIKSYAVNDRERIIFLINRASIYTSVLLLIFTLPLLLETEFILSLWLTEVPAYTAVFCRYVLLFNLFANLSSVVIIGIHATGKIKRPSIINGTIYLSVVPFAYVAYKMGADAQFAFFYNVVAVFLGMFSNIWTLHLYIPEFSVKEYMTVVLGKSFLIAVFVGGVTLAVSQWIPAGWFRLLGVGMLSTSLLLLTTYYLVLNREERNLLILKLKQIYHV